MKKGLALRSLLLALVLVLTLGLSAACVGDRGPRLSMLKAEGMNVVNEKGELVQLRGLNAGNLGVFEFWMAGFNYSPRTGDQYRVTQVFLERFDVEQTKELMLEYQAAYWKDIDFDNCKEMGINVIRLPFTYMNLDFAAVYDDEEAGKNYDFTFLDDFVEKAAERGIYTILDMHGAYGSQNGQDHSGQSLSRDQVDFYENERKISLTEKLWGAIAEHFKDNPNVAGYDLLNEPGEKAGATTTRHFKVFDRLYKAIRATGDNHIVIFESCWGGENMPRPEEYGWENCMYSFHHYTGCAGPDSYPEHVSSFRARLKEVEDCNFGIPLNMGEFTCYGNPDQWDATLQMLNDHGWSWTSWTYKTWGAGAWGVYNIVLPNEEAVNAETDSLETILRKMRQQGTDVPGSVKATVLGERTLAEIIRKYATAAPTAAKAPEAN